MKLDHVNIRTAQLDAMRAWYAEALGLEDGWRPPFPFPGAWLYAGEDPIVHLVGVDTRPGAPESGVRLEHFAISNDGDIDAFRARLAGADVAVDEAKVPGTNIVQLNIRDPDGNHIHIDFRV